MQYFKKLLLFFLSWRLLLFIPLFFLQFIPSPSDTRYLGISAWANFDGVHYLSIVVNGYNTEARFFPLYPLLIKIIGIILHTNLTTQSAFIIGFLLSNVFFLLALFFLYKLILLDHKEYIVKWTIIFLLIFPTSFFFGSIYAESLFLFCAVLSLYCARKQKWLFALLVAVFLPVIRPVGIAILPALCIEWILQKKERNKPLARRTRGKPSYLALFSLFFIPISIIGYAFYNFIKWGNWLYFIQAQSELSNGRLTGIILIPQTLFRYAKMLLTVSPTQYVWHIALLELGVFIFAAILLYIGYLKKIRLSYLIFAVVAFLIPTSTGTFTGLPRYVLVLFPIFTALALIKNTKIKIVYIIVSVILSVILLMLFARGYYIS